MKRRSLPLLCTFPLLALGGLAVAQPVQSLRPLIQVQPDYPQTAVERGIQGYVELDVTITERGTVEEAAVVAAVPEGVFEQAARAAVMRWRYPAEPGRAPQSAVERIEFRVPVAPTVLEQPRAAAPPATRNGRSGTRNACVREESKFNYGDRVDVALINACDVPLVVAGCTTGTGQYRGRWTCSTTERSASLLVPTSDGRVGESTLLGTENGEISMTFTDRLVVSRAPNSEYWWLACTLDDALCREAAGVWIRSLDGQLENADPQGRSNATLARSY